MDPGVDFDELEDAHCIDAHAEDVLTLTRGQLLEFAAGQQLNDEA